jgi:hypothetical protein
MEKNFWGALFSGWQGILSTSGSIVLLAIAVWLWDKPTPRWFTLGTAGICFVFAARRAWMIERKARSDAETKITELIRKPVRTRTEQADYDTIQEALKVVGQQKGREALRFLRNKGTVGIGLRFGNPASGPTPPTGLTLGDLRYVYGHCESTGIVNKTTDIGGGAETFTMPPHMCKALEQVLFED